MNYTLNEYHASDVVHRHWKSEKSADARDVPHPMIVSESGRAQVPCATVCWCSTHWVSSRPDHFPVIQ